MLTKNRASIIGHVGKDPEIRNTNTGKQVANFSIATQEAGDRTEWHRVIAWEKQAEVVRDMVQRGTALEIEGRLQTRKWEKDGQTHYTTEIVAYRVNVLAKGKEQAPQAHSAPAPTPAEARGEGIYETDDAELPF